VVRRGGSARPLQTQAVIGTPLLHWTQVDESRGWVWSGIELRAGANIQGRPQRASKAPSLELFMAQLAEIAPESGTQIGPESDLIDDLCFDEAAFGRLASLLYRCYGVAGISVGYMRSEPRLTVGGFFRRCVLEVLGFVPVDQQWISDAQGPRNGPPPRRRP
jgi:hypothetical protein